MAYENILVEKRDNIGYVTVNRPEVMNALSVKTVLELTDAFESLAGDPEVVGVILTGSGAKSFVAGADITEFLELSADGARDYAKRGQNLLSVIERLGKPVVAAVNGYALGGGCEIAMACTYRIASENAKLGQPEVSLGLIPGFGGTQRLPRLVGKGRAMEMILTGNPIDAATAERYGLVNRVVPQDGLMEECEKAVKTNKDAFRFGERVSEFYRKGLETGIDPAKLRRLCAAVDPERVELESLRIWKEAFNKHPGILAEGQGDVGEIPGTVEAAKEVLADGKWGN